ncbi:hypothetical protein TNCV_2758121 [Trichonephila clavipes]|nr:hypothetical protein TNCV_2758111 [Trichonephila clavipes]GFW98633.1 hypothetical protein TNCV_2758121 [Trichonephila clavipes]
MSLEVDSDDFQELPEPHNQELGIDELIEMHEQDIEEHCVFKPSEIRRSNDATRGLLATDHVILNHGQVTWTTPELAPPSPNYHTTPTGGRFSSRQI